MEKRKIIGRKAELKTLKNIVKSQESEFLAIYGRRRVGKTYLIREFFSNQGFFFELTGQKDASLSEQLINFTKNFSDTFVDSLSLTPPKNWKSAFELITKSFQKIPKSKKCILFLDELPWLASKRSGLIQALDYYWNRYWSSQKNFILIVCGSAASWMLDNLINAKGGLYNRLTRVMLLKPFSLGETLSYLQSRGINLNTKQFCNLYMAIGGIPHYLKQISKGMSTPEAISKICFQSDGLLYSEFDRLFDSLFDDSHVHLKIIRAIAKQRFGISREELIKQTKLKSGGTINKRLDELEAAGFIQTYIPYGKRKKNHFFRVIDEYILFYLNWIDPLKQKGVKVGNSYWQTKFNTPAVAAWAGYAFEVLCLKHVEQIRTALSLEAVSCEVGSWRYIPAKGKHEKGAQIDLLFDRNDGVITLFEIKYSDRILPLDKALCKDLAHKIQTFERHTATKKQIQLAMITLQGIRDTVWSEDLVDQDILFEELF